MIDESEEPKSAFDAIMEGINDMIEYNKGNKSGCIETVLEVSNNAKEQEAKRNELMAQPVVDLAAVRKTKKVTRTVKKVRETRYD